MLTTLLGKMARVKGDEAVLHEVVGVHLRPPAYEVYVVLLDDCGELWVEDVRDILIAGVEPKQA